MRPRSENKIKAIGLMSGTSLDGLDLVAAEFWQNNGKWNFNIVAAETENYAIDWTEQLKTASTLSGQQLIKLHVEYGRYLGQKTKAFIQKTRFTPELIASHGHTIFHQPENGFTFQLGSGFEIAGIAGITTVADFRSGDVALGGQGAPLVPAGDKLLFSNFEYCLNLGGFANISFEENNYRKAFDICPVNIVFNYFASKNGHLFDCNGNLGRIGNIDFLLLEKLNSLDFYKKEPPKSLGREWVESKFLPVLEKFECPESDKIRTVYEHVAQQISKIIRNNEKLLITGGGAWNTFLIELIEAKSNIKITIPPGKIVNFKEALVFAFLGTLRVQNTINCFSSVTGAKNDHSAGVIFQAKTSN
ncbi:MAG: anhydro-N-acetylmuramic acid kinase [Draconibacterium sp.]